MLSPEHKQHLRNQVLLKLHEAVEKARLELLLAQANLAACESQLEDFAAASAEQGDSDAG